MLVLKVPNGPRITWRDRRDSRVTVLRTYRWLFWGDDEPSSEVRLRIELNLPRALFSARGEPLNTLLRLGVALTDAAQCRQRVRGDHLTIRVQLSSAGRPRALLTLPRKGLPLLRREDGEKLGAGLCAWCFPAFFARLIATPPRRGGLTLRRLTLLLPAAFVAAHALVGQAESDTRLRGRIGRAIQDDDAVRGYLAAAEEFGWNQQQATTVGLVDRAFRGAWEQVKHPGVMHSPTSDVVPYLIARRLPPPQVLYRDPATVLRKYLYGRKRQTLTDSIVTMKDRCPARWDLLRSWWEETYLGEPGAAARAFGLT